MSLVADGQDGNGLQLEKSRLNFSSYFHAFSKKSILIKGTKRLVSVNICSVEGYSVGIFVSKMSPAILVIKVQ